jgi:alkylation response protein AidB-like acyl-CoA dehydrogenase
MQVGFTEDQIQFREVVSRFLAAKSPPTAVRALMATEAGHDPLVWSQLCGELGLAGTHLPEAYGGFGFGPVELGIAMQEMGRYLYCGPFFASAVMAGYAILNAGTEDAKQALLPNIADGSIIAALVLDDLSAPDAVGHSIEAVGERLSGTAKMVVDAQIADVLIVAANSTDGVSLYQVDRVGDVEIQALQVVDPTRKLSQVRFADVPAKLISQPGKAELELLWDQMSVALAHEMVGGSEALFESTIDYMQMRVQFGRSIASFQALKHRCADLLLELELAKANTHEAARYLATGQGDAYAPSMAKAAASDAYMSVAKAAIQLRGGIGFTWEEDTHLWFKRAKSSEVFLGTPNVHRERMMTILENTANG